MPDFRRPPPPHFGPHPGLVPAALSPKNNLALILGAIGGALATGGTGAIIGALAGFAVDSFYKGRIKRGA
jgi:VIT1/CCC1 family predicted Fe2+/Mn2+ transporter